MNIAGATKCTKPVVPPVQFDPQQAAEYLSLSRATVYKLMGGDELAHYKLGRRTLITKKACDQFVARKELEYRRRCN